MALTSVKNLWSGILKKSAAALTWTVVMSVICAVAVDREWISFDTVGYAAMGILLISGLLCGRGGKGEGRLVSGLLSVAGYVLSLLILNLLFFGGEFDSALVCIALVLLGLLLRVGLSMGAQKKNGRRGYKIPKG